MHMTKAEKREALEPHLIELAEQAKARTEMTADDVFEAILQDVREAPARLERLLRAITMRLPWLPEYVAVRNRWHSIPSWLHWLFPRLRKRYERLRLKQQQVTINAVIEWGKERITPRKHVFHVGSCCMRADCDCSKHGGRAGADLAEPPLHEGCDCYLVPFWDEEE